MSWPAPFAPVPCLAAAAVHRRVSHRFPETVEAIARAGGQVKKKYKLCGMIPSSSCSILQQLKLKNIYYVS